MWNEENDEEENSGMTIRKDFAEKRSEKEMNDPRNERQESAWEKVAEWSEGDEKKGELLDKKWDK